MKEKDEEELFRNKVNLNWYPGHMAKAKRLISEQLNLIDVVIEILDSRIPISSQNPDIATITKNKKKIILLNKSDLAEEEQNKLWKKHFEKAGFNSIIVNSNNGQGISKITEVIEKIMKDEIEKYAKKGRVGRKIRVMILGIPNVGKSTFINKFTKSSKLEVENRPGVTKKNQWVSINEKINLLDTPGVLWPKFESQQVALNLSFTGTIKDEILPQTEIAYELLKYLLYNYRENVIERYKISNEYIEETLNYDQPENLNIYEIMQQIGRKRGAIISGGNIDDEKVSKIIIDDFRSGRLGRITLEKCEKGEV